MKRQGFALHDVPPKSALLRLRDTSNLHTGGRLEDVTDRIHPDNVRMAESIARAFRLDAIGIDFITPDIGKSWRETDCAVIEVNAAPGIGDVLAERLLRDKFPDDAASRIPCVLMVGFATDAAAAVVQQLAGSGKRVGYADGRTAVLDGERRFLGETALPAAILALLLDPACEVLVASCRAGALAGDGLPYLRFDLVLVAQSTSLPDDVAALLAAHCGAVVELGKTGRREIGIILERLAA